MLNFQFKCTKCSLVLKYFFYLAFVSMLGIYLIWNWCKLMNCTKISPFFHKLNSVFIKLFIQLKKKLGKQIESHNSNRIFSLLNIFFVKRYCCIRFSHKKNVTIKCKNEKLSCKYGARIIHKTFSWCLS